ncbi:MAG: hypothetical protein DDT26_01108 [Dehalococcoidia bacterium]|nr:hypothetical protein [Chloroflexota bacterium]
MSGSSTTEQRVAVMVDCDNTTPEILEYALQMAAQFGRVVVRRGYGNHSTLSNRWQEALVRLAFTPCLQYQYASGKNTADIALALDALELMFDDRVDAFCLVTSDSDFAYLCRKVKERGALIYIVGEAKTPEALRHASDLFFEWAVAPKVAPVGSAPKPAVGRPEIAPAKPQLPKAIPDAVTLLVQGADDGRVGMAQLGQYLKRTDPSFSPKRFGYGTLSELVKAYSKLSVTKDPASGMWVSKKQKIP